MTYKALLIAVDTYREVSPLPNTVNDASVIKSLLLEEPSLYDSSGIQYIHGNIATKTILEASLETFFDQADPEDVLILYWAGHGALVNDEGYFVPFDGVTPDSMISMSHVRELIDKTKAKTVLSFFDTCHSGAVARKTQREMLRGIEVYGEGKVLIAACTPDQSAWDRNGHGAFTDYLIQGLKGEAANSRGGIDTYNLYSYISDKLKEEFQDSSQTPVMKSTLSGPPIVIKNISRKDRDIINSSINYKLDSSGYYFLLGSLIAGYDEYIEIDSEFQLTLRSLSAEEDNQIKSMRNTEQIFAVHNGAYKVHVKNVEVRATREGLIYLIKLVPKAFNQNHLFTDMSYNENGKVVTSEDIAKMRIERILLGTASNEQGFNRSFSIIEHAIMEPQNAAMKVVPNLIEKLAEQELNLEQIRITTIANLILTGTLQNLEKLEFEVEDNNLVSIHLIGYRPKFYTNVPAARIEFKRDVSIKLKSTEE